MTGHGGGELVEERTARPGLRAIDWARIALLATYVAFLASLLALGSREASVQDLREGIAAGRVDVVEVAAGGIDQMHELRWREGLVRQRLELRAPSRSGSSGDVVLLRDEPERWLEERGVQVRPGELDGGSTSIGLWADGPTWWVPGAWTGVVALIGGVATLMLLVGGPPPWRATPWAWFWLLWTPLGALAFLALSGPGTSPRPRNPSRRLTGLPGLVIAALVMPLLHLAVGRLLMSV